MDEETSKTTGDLQRQYDEMEKGLLEKINTAKSDVAEREDTLKNKVQEIEDLAKATDESRAKKEAEIDALRRQIDEMSSDFAEMLKQTLGKMQERIELANVQWDGDDGA